MGIGGAALGGSIPIRAISIDEDAIPVLLDDCDAVGTEGLSNLAGDFSNPTELSPLPPL